MKLRVIELQGGPMNDVKIEVPADHGIGEVVLREPIFKDGKEGSIGFTDHTYSIFDGTETDDAVTDFAMFMKTSRVLQGIDAFDEVEPAQAGECETCGR